MSRSLRVALALSAAVALRPALASAQTFLDDDPLADIDAGDAEIDVREALRSAEALCRRANDAASRALAADAVARLALLPVSARDLAAARLCTAELNAADVGVLETALAAAVEADASQWRAQLRLIDLALRTARPRRALALIAERLRQHPDDPELLLRLAQVRRQLGDRRGANDVLLLLERAYPSGTIAQQVRDALHPLRPPAVRGRSLSPLTRAEMAELVRAQEEMQRRMQLQQEAQRALDGGAGGAALDGGASNATQ